MNPWDTRYAGETFVYGTKPNDFLVESHRHLPPGGRILSLGEGEGRNGVYLAEQGFSVIGMDGSAVGMEKARWLAASRGVTLETLVGDLAEVPLPENVDGIISIFCHLPSALRRDVAQRAKAVLRPGGVILIEAYHPDQIGRGTGGPSDLDMLPRLTDLRDDWAGCEEILGQEMVREVIEGALHRGHAAVTQAIFRKPITE